MSQYHIARDGQQLGVHSEQDIQSGLSSGTFQGTDLCWTEGMGEWELVSARFSVQAPAVFTQPASVAAGAYNPYAAPQANVVPVYTGNDQLASLGKRLGAAILDGLLALVLMGVPYGFLIMELDGFEKNPNPEFSSTAVIATVALAVGFLILLVINIVMLTTRGQTPGKMMLGIRIVTHPDGQKPGFVKAFLLRAFVNGIIGAVPCLGPIYSLVDICFIFREDRRCIHDLIAGTHVVEGNPPKN
ncbi:MAG: RDD family protein [Prosthecobacter sp.]